MKTLLEHLRISIVATIALAVLVCGVYPLVVWGLAQTFFHHKANGSLITDAGGNVIGSELIGQNFTDAKYFHPRPSAAGNGYDPTASGGSNLGPTSAKLFNGTTRPTTMPSTQPAGDPVPGPDAVDFDGIKLRTILYAQDYGIEIQVTSGPPLDSFKDSKGELDQVKLVKAFSDGANPLVFHALTPIPADAVTASGSGLDPHISVANAMLQAPRVAKARGLSEELVKALVRKYTEGPDLFIFGDAGVNVLKLNLALDQSK